MTTATKHFALAACALALLPLAALSIRAQAQTPTAPTFTATGELTLPSDFREWVFVGTSLGMTYGPSKRTDPAVFENIYVTRAAYQAFMKSGKWPEQTMFVMEGRGAETHQLLANTGQTAGDALFVEASVKDSKRFPEHGWGYFNFGGGKAPKASAPMLATRFDCYSCHAQNTAVEYSFAQFYPAVYEAAKKFGTVKPTYDPNKKF